MPSRLRQRKPSSQGHPRSESSQAEHWCGQLTALDCITDVRGDVLRIGFGLYHDEGDIAAFAALASRLV